MNSALSRKVCHSRCYDSVYTVDKKGIRFLLTSLTLLTYKGHKTIDDLCIPHNTSGLEDNKHVLVTVTQYKALNVYIENILTFANDSRWTRSIL